VVRGSGDLEKISRWVEWMRRNAVECRRRQLFIVKGLRTLANVPLLVIVLLVDEVDEVDEVDGNQTTASHTHL
jgi:hypothetical protein